MGGLIQQRLSKNKNMSRRVYLSLVLLSITHSFYCQDYEPFPSDSIAWLYVTTTWDSFGNAESEAFFYYLSGDTTIGSQEFGFLYQTPTNQFIDNQFYHYNPASNYFVGLWKEEDKQVFLYPQIDLLEELLLYDFNLAEGDTMAWEGYQITGLTEEVISIFLGNSEIQIANGEMRNLYGYDEIYTEVIEGIGTTIGELIAPGVNVDTSTDLLCASKENELLFSQELLGINIDSPFSCLNVMTDIDDIEIKRISLYPNPSSDFIYLELPFIQDLIFQVYDQVGKRIFVPFRNNNGNIFMDIVHLPSGMYTIRSQSDDKLHFIGKFVKQ